MQDRFRAVWGNAMSIVTHTPQQYAKDITLRYAFPCTFFGNKVRITLDNFTGKEAVHFAKVTIGKVSQNQDVLASTMVPVTFDGKPTLTLEPAAKKQSDAIDFTIQKGEMLAVSFYLDQWTHMRCGVATQGRYSNGYFAEGDFCEAGIFPRDFSMPTEWVFFLNEVDVSPCEKSHAILCYGDSITAQNWPDDLTHLFLQKKKPVSVIRRAVSGARILKEYHCIQYEAYGLKGDRRFPHELEAAGCDTIIILQGINDIIHPVGAGNNVFRPWADLPSAQAIIEGLRYYINFAKHHRKRVFVGTLTPIEGWRTYAMFRERIREEVNEWIRTTDEIDGYIDFDKALRDENNPHALKTEMDSGDHLHPGPKGYEAMAKIAYDVLEKHSVF